MKTIGGLSQFGGNAGFGISGNNGGFSNNQFGESMFDPDAFSFMLATQIPDNDTVYYPGTIYEQTGHDFWIYINDLVLDLKDKNEWNNLLAYYPIIGGTAFTHKWNLVDPRDLNEAFRLEFLGGWVHGPTGALGNGINTFARTFLRPSVDIGSSNSNYFFFYSRTNSNGVYCDGGSIANAGAEHLAMYSRLSNDIYADNGTLASHRQIIPNLDSSGFFVNNRTSNIVFNVFKNDIKMGTNTVLNSANLPFTEFIFGAITNYESGIQVQFSNREYISFGISEQGLTDQGELNVYNSNQQLQTSLVRQI